jgi:hypothetical protein
MTFESLRRAAVEQYEAFVAPRPRSVEGCSCCTTSRQLAALVAAPREELPASVLDFYARKAITTVGGIAEFRYFWPRLAEQAIAGELTTDREVVFGKPLYGAHRTWPAPERAALLSLASALGEWLGAEQLEEFEVDRWVCAIGLLAEELTDVRPLLAPLLAKTESAWANLLAFVAWNRDQLDKKHRLASAFWKSAPQSAAAVVEWYSSEPRVREAVYALDVQSAELYGTPMPVRPPTGS